MWGFPVWQRPRLHSDGTRSRPAWLPAVLRDGPSAHAGSFIKSLDDPLVLRRMARPRADVREAKLLQKLADIARMKVDAEPLGDDVLEVDTPPAHNAVLFPIGACFHDLRERGHLLLRQTRLGPFGPTVDEPIRPRGVEAMNPIAKRLAIHAANLRCRAAIHSVPDRGQRQKPPALADILRSPGKRPKLLARIVLSQSHRCRHGANLLAPKETETPPKRTPN